MIVKSDIIQKPQIKNILTVTIKPLNKAVGYVLDVKSDKSNITSELVNLIKKMKLVLRKKPFLNPKSEVRAFFGLENYEKMSYEKTESLLTYFKNFELGANFFNIENSQSCSINDRKSLVNLFKSLKPDYGCAKITFNDKCFNGVFHTLGFVRHNGILYILDSLGHNKNVNSNILNFHNKLRNVLSACKIDLKPEKIILNQNTQQSVDELTCNHWAYANIETLIKSLKSGKTIRTNEELDNVLPIDINKILEEHKKFVLDRYLRYSF